MTAGPIISDALLTKTATQLFGSVFINNIASASGMVKISLHNYISSTCQAELSSITECTPRTSNSYISNLRHLALFLYNSASLPSSACVRTYICSSQTTCPTCTTYNTGYYNGMNNISVNASLGLFPDPVTGMNATVGNGSAVVRFTPPSNTYVTYYEITLTQGANFLASNLYLNYNSTSGIPISNLTNGLQYTLAVRPLSDDGYIGPVMSVNFTPVAPCVNLACNIGIV